MGASPCVSSWSSFRMPLVRPQQLSFNQGNAHKCARNNTWSAQSGFGCLSAATVPCLRWIHWCLPLAPRDAPPMPAMADITRQLCMRRWPAAGRGAGQHPVAARRQAAVQQARACVRGMRGVGGAGPQAGAPARSLQTSAAWPPPSAVVTASKAAALLGQP